MTTIARNEYIFVTKTPQTITKKCNGKTEHIAVQAEYHLRLHEPCEVITKDHVIRTGHDLSVNEKVKEWPLNWNVTEHLFGLDARALENVVTDLKLIKNHPAPIRDLHQLLANQIHQKINWGMTLIIIFITLIIITIISYLGFRYIQLRRKQVQP